jgi:hypothetical protein
LKLTFETKADKLLVAFLEYWPSRIRNLNTKPGTGFNRAYMPEEKETYHTT